VAERRPVDEDAGGEQQPGAAGELSAALGAEPDLLDVEGFPAIRASTSLASDAPLWLAVAVDRTRQGAIR